MNLKEYEEKYSNILPTIWWEEILYGEEWKVNIIQGNQIVDKNNYHYVSFLAEATEDINLHGIRKEERFILQTSGKTLGDRILRVSRMHNKKIYLHFTRKNQLRTIIKEIKILE